MTQTTERVSDCPVPTLQEIADSLVVAVALAMQHDTDFLMQIASNVHEFDAMLRVIEKKGYTHHDGTARDILDRYLLTKSDETENYSSTEGS